MKDGEVWQKLLDPTSTIGAKLLRTRYTAVEGDHALRASFLDGTFNGDLVSDPSGTNEIAFHERNPVLQSEVVDLLAIDDRDHDLGVADDALPGSRTERQRVCPRTVNRFVIHRYDTEIALFISMANVIMAGRSGEEQP